jgi:uncharacterized protein YraI
MRLHDAHLGLEGRAPPMSRVVSVCLCAILAFVAVTGASLLGPVPALAASGTLTMETPLHEAPDHGSRLIALLPEGTVVSIDGPPVDGFYPVSTGELSGWMRGETLELAKDIIEDPAESDATPEVTDVYLPAEQQTGDATLPAVDPASQTPDQATDPALTGELPADQAMANNPALTGDPASDSTQANAPSDDPWVSPDAPTEPATSEIITDPAVQEPAAPTDVGPAAETLDPSISGPESVSTDPAAMETVTAEPTIDPLATSTPVPGPVEMNGGTEGATGLEPPAAPSVTPLPVVEPAPTGPAGVLVDMPIRSGPGPDFGLIFTVPAGSTVEQTGQLVDGYVSVQYKEVSGWAAREHLAQPSDFVPEAPPEETAEPIDTKTPRPGSGVAYTTVDLSLRDGPSANAEPITTVPAGSRLVLTGVMEGDFQRVTYGDLVGWIANEYLTTPDDPAPNGEGTGKQENYSQRQIVRYIYQAADRYDQSREDMLRVAQCESNLDPYAVNPSGSYGLFQFIRTTWKSTPYGKKDIFDPEANANAAGWMWSQGRKSEWVCQ